jgi:uncharacterized membrane protein
VSQTNLSTTTLGLGKGRIEALTDGIFATVMTVLVLSLSIPTITSASSSTPFDIYTYVFNLGPLVLSYVLSFLTLSVFWVRHHNFFHFITRVDSAFIWLNIVFLLTIGFIPFSTELIGRYSMYELSTIIYGADLIAIGICMQAIWFYSTRHKLVSEGLQEKEMSQINRRLTGGPILYFSAILFSVIPTIGTKIALGIYILSLIYYVIASSTGLGTPWNLLRRGIGHSEHSG